MPSDRCFICDPSLPPVFICHEHTLVRLYHVKTDDSRVPLQVERVPDGDGYTLNFVGGPVSLGPGEALALQFVADDPEEN